VSVDVLTVAEAAQIMREAVRDKSWQDTTLGGDVAAYLRTKRKRLTDRSYQDYESGLDKLCWHFAGLALADLEPPVGTDRVEDFLDRQWGAREPRTYNKNLSILHDFFKHAVRRGAMRGDPTLVIERAKARGVYRTTFTADQRRAIIAESPELRDRIALRLLLDYGIRKGSLQAVRFQHFDHARKRLTIFAKGGRVRNVPIPDPAFWDDLGRLIVETAAAGQHFLMPQQRGNGTRMVAFPDRPKGAHGMHSWWYRALARAGVVPEGVTSGERLHKARHTAGQRMLDATGNLKAVQMLLGHTSIQTTADVYTDWDEDHLAGSLMEVLAKDEIEQ
jgi:integrase